MGAWIEILLYLSVHKYLLVAPLVGAWIEIERKYLKPCPKRNVAPLVGAWIEIFHRLTFNS